MKRLLAFAALLGALNATVLLVVMWQPWSDPVEFGWFAYAPLSDVPDEVLPPGPSLWRELWLVPAVAALDVALAWVAWRWVTRPGARVAEPSHSA